MQNEQMKCCENGSKASCSESCRCNCQPGQCKCAAGEPCEGCKSSCKAAD